MDRMAMRRVRMVRRLLVIAGIVVLRSFEVMVSCVLVMLGRRSVMLRTFMSLHESLLCNLSFSATTFHRCCNRLVTDFHQSCDRPTEQAR